MPFDRVEYRKQYYQKNKEKQLQYRKEYYQKNKEKEIQKRKEYVLENPEKTTKCLRISNWKNRGLICEDYDKLYNYYLSIDECQNCGFQLNQDLSTRKCLDHCHESGEFRNVLCHSCNIKRK